MLKKEMIAMLLAGGQGTRLGSFTKNLAKPAVPFGGKYRIIDFTLSNCSNSGIDTVGVLTQYRPLVLNKHIGVGSPWDLDRQNGGVAILPPYTKENEGCWYRGTGHAIYENMNFIERYNPKYLLVLSGDHIYKMDYNKILEYHKEQKAEVTIPVKTVDWEDASRFGIMNTDSNGLIYEFEEKPLNPKNNLASMGIYIFNWKTLQKYFISCEENKIPFNDFGKDIIPKMLQDNICMKAYNFDGYWKDVGTIESLWQANMDLLNNNINLNDNNWKIYSKDIAMTPQYIGRNCKINNSIITDGSVVLGSVENSVISYGVSIGEGSIIKDTVIMPNVCIGKNVIINKAMIGEGAVIGDNCRLNNENGEIIAIGKNRSIFTTELIKCSST